MADERIPGATGDQPAPVLAEARSRGWTVRKPQTRAQSLREEGYVGPKAMSYSRVNSCDNPSDPVITAPAEIIPASAR